jgi:hypothetical protein
MFSAEENVIHYIGRPWITIISIQIGGFDDLKYYTITA